MTQQVNYACVAYQMTVLAQAGYSQKIEQQYAADIDNVLVNFKNRDNMRTCQEQPQSTFAVQITNGVTFICFCGPSVKKASAYGFLQDLQQQFSAKFGIDSIKFASKLQMQREFGPSISNCMLQIAKYGSQTQKLQNELQEVKDLVMDNINQVMKRASALDEIENDAAQLKDNAAEFYDETANLKKIMMCKRAGIIAGICIAAVAVVAAIVIPLVLKYVKK